MSNVHVAVQFNPTISGTVTQPDYSDWVQVKSVTAAVHRKISSGSKGEDRTGGSEAEALSSYNDIILTRAHDKSSIDLWKACLNGKFFTEVVIEFFTVSGKSATPKLKRTLKNVVVSSCSFFGSGTTAATSEFATEEVTLNFESEEIT